MTGQLDTLTSLPVTDLARLVRERAVSPVEVVEAALARVDELDPTLHAFCELTADRARIQAREQTDALARGEDLGPLGGVPIAIKDLIATAGVHTRCGSPAYRDFVPEEATSSSSGSGPPGRSRWARRPSPSSATPGWPQPGVPHRAQPLGAPVQARASPSRRG